MMVLQSRLRERTGRREAAIWIFIFALMGVLVGLPRTALAVPSFATQTGLPCAQCHVMAFGPQLTEFGRQFKLNGYTFKRQDGALNIPLSLTAIAAYNNVSKAAPAPSPFSDKDNFYLQSASVYFAGRIADHLGAFVKGTYDGVGRLGFWDSLDVRYARSFELGGHALVGGLDMNNSPTVSDLWNSTPIWGFPYVSSSLGVGPLGAPILRGLISGSVLGASVYSMIDNKFYVELGFYRGLSDKWLHNVGYAGATKIIEGAAPYGRLAWQQHKGAHYFEVGLVGLSVKQQPYSTTTETDHYTDYGVDASYQFSVGTPQAFDAHFSWIHENRSLDASFATHVSDAVSNSTDTIQVDASYVMSQTWATTFGLFDISGTTNHLLFAPSPVFGSGSGSPDSRGFIARLEWVPFGKVGSFASPWVNLRLGLQYTGYWRFNGGSTNYDGFGRSASDNNSLFLYSWFAF
jgi:hypothetical protein